MLFTRIVRSSCPIDLAEWNNIIATHPCLEPMPDRTGVDPFTQTKTLFPGRGKAFYIADGQRAGNAVLEKGEILTTGVPEAVCEELAARLDAKVREDDRS